MEFCRVCLPGSLGATRALRLAVVGLLFLLRGALALRGLAAGESHFGECMAVLRDVDHQGLVLVCVYVWERLFMVGGFGECVWMLEDDTLLK